MSEDNEPFLTIPLEDLIRILQLNNPDLYKTAQSDKAEFVIGNMRYTSGYLGQGLLDEQRDEDVLKNSQLRYFGYNNCIMACLLDKIDSETPSPRRIMVCSFHMTMIPDDKKSQARFSVTPYFCLEGELDVEGLVSIDRMSVIAGGTEDIYHVLSADNSTDVKAFMLYANFIFSSMVREQAVSLTDLGKLVSNNVVLQNSNLYESLKRRNAMDVYFIRNKIETDDTRHNVSGTEYANIFQTTNTDIFEAVVDEDIPDISALTEGFLKTAESDYAYHFQDLENEYAIPPLFTLNSYGDVIWHFAYTRPDDFGVMREYRLILVLGADHPPENAPFDALPVVKPMAVLMCECDNAGNIEPLEQIALIHGHNKNFYHKFRSPHGYLGLACLIESALESVRIDERLDERVLSEWMSNQYPHEVEARYTFLANRTQAGFERAISELAEIAPPQLDIPLPPRILH
jgi:hypothetical protein